jgi:transcriptional regulator with XRE-family HTH domain
MEARAMSADELAEQSGVLASTIRKMRIGAHEATDRTLAKLAAALGVTPAELIDDSAQAEWAGRP